MNILHSVKLLYMYSSAMKFSANIYLYSDSNNACVLENYTCYSRMMLINLPPSFQKKKYIYYFVKMLIIPPLPSQRMSSVDEYYLNE